jgi:uncharacterized phage protein gp47/JayE
MAFKLPSLRELIDDVVRDFSNKFPGANVAKKSDNWLRAAVKATAVALVLRRLRVIERDLWPDTASGDELERHAAIRGITRRPATPAKKANAGRLVGTATSAFTAGAQLTHASGLRFQLNESGAIPGGGFIDVDILAIDVGSATRLSAGEVLTFVSPPAGINAQVALVLSLDEDGADEETDGELQTRILDKIAQPGMGGNANDYRQWAKEVTGIFEAYVWPNRGGLGSVHIAAVHPGSGAARILSAGEVTALQTYLDGKRPVGMADCKVLTVVEQKQQIDLRVTVDSDPQFAWDWVDNGAWTVASWTGGTRTLQLSANRPADMQVGDRLTYKRTTGTLNSGKQHVIEAFGSNPDEVVLKDDPELAATPPVAGNPVYAGGAIVDPIREKGQALIDALGPGRPDTWPYVGTRPDYSVGGTYWDGTLRPSRLQAAAAKVDGAVDTIVVAPAANVEATNLAPANTVNLITVDQFIVRQ